MKNLKLFRVLLAIAILGLLDSCLLRADEFNIKSGSKVRFEYQIAAIDFIGSFDIKSSMFNLSPRSPNESKVDITFDVANSSAGFSLATKLMLGDKVLDSENYPFMKFRSKTIEYVDNVFKIQGFLTIRGITKPAVIRAYLSNPKNKPLYKLKQFEFEIVGDINRNDFGAGGYAPLVGSHVRLKSRVTLEAN